MLRLFVLSFALFFTFDAYAATCYPSSPAAVRVGQSTGATPGLWAYWYCNADDATAVQPNWRAIPTSKVTVTMFAAARSYAVGTNPNFVKTPYALPASDPSIAPIYAAMIAAAKAERAASKLP